LGLVIISHFFYPTNFYLRLDFNKNGNHQIPKQQTMNKTLLFFAILFIGSTITAQEELTNDLIWYSREFSAEYVSGINSMNDGAHYTSLEYGDDGSSIVKYSYETGEKVSTIASSSDVFKKTDYSIEGYEFNADETKLLIRTETEYIYRHSFEANYYVYDIKSKRAFPLAELKEGKQRLASFSPDGSNIAFVRNNNIFIQEQESKEEIQVTYDGEKNKIINGYPDWVYEEEFGFNNGIYWSPKGDRIAYYKFDESQVKEFQMAMYGELYPDQYKFKYPKAGEDNSVVSIHIYDLNAMATKRVSLGTNPDVYFPRIKWTLNNNKLCVMRMNRHQNHLEFLTTDLSKEQPFELETTLIFEEKADTYIEINDNLIFLQYGVFADE